MSTIPWHAPCATACAREECAGTGDRVCWHSGTGDRVCWHRGSRVLAQGIACAGTNSKITKAPPDTAKSSATVLNNTSTPHRRTQPNETPSYHQPERSTTRATPRCCAFTSTSICSHLSISARRQPCCRWRTTRTARNTSATSQVIL